MQSTVILGSGGHAKVIIEMMREFGPYTPVGVLAPAGDTADTVLGVPRLGDDAILPSLIEKGIRCAFVAIGDNLLRERLCREAVEQGFELASVVSKSAIISPTASLGHGIAIMPGAHVGPDSSIGDGAIVNTLASVDHDGVLGACCHVAPGATLAGCVTVGTRAFVGTGASVIPERQIGPGSIVGAGSVVVRNIPGDVVAFGNPARVVRELVPTTQQPSKSDGERPRLRLVS